MILFTDETAKILFNLIILGIIITEKKIVNKIFI